MKITLKQPLVFQCKGVGGFQTQQVTLTNPIKLLLVSRLMQNDVLTLDVCSENG